MDMKVLGFAMYKPYAVVLREVNGGRHCAVLLRRDYFTMLRLMFESPGEPLISHEVACEAHRMFGITIASIAGVLDRHMEVIDFRIKFRFNEREWESPVLAFDAVGYSIAGNVPISMPEEDVAFLARMTPSLERLGLEPVDAAAESLDEATLLARELPKGKLREH
ncbi:MAG TPA: hypothetical protein VMJ72_00995 [Candidatus Paceibacterota bacterium]|nr:hypothetical protein [Candidatus Paceibacterota bacterium]